MFETVAAALLEKVCVTFELSYTATIRRPVAKAIFAIWVVGPIRHNLSTVYGVSKSLLCTEPYLVQIATNFDIFWPVI